MFIRIFNPAGFLKALRIMLIALFLAVAAGLPQGVWAQKIFQLDSDRIQLVYLGKRYTYLTPHVLRSFENAMDFHQGLWDYEPGKVYVLLNDFQDYGTGGAISIPLNQVLLGIGPYSFAFSIIPSSERFQWLFNHELTHIVMTDKPNSSDEFWRKAFLGKVLRDEQKPLSALWSYATVPRWYAPRWYQEGIACFMETWMSGGLGRAMGYYDEMYFRSLAFEEKPIHSVVGLETEGTSEDFQVGANSYLYGTRFVTYLAREYGIDKLRDFYLRTENSKAFFGSQFSQVYEKPLGQAWDEWIEFEREFQNENIHRIKEYPLTHFSPITNEPLGSVSSFRYNPETDKIYAAINHPGVISQIAEIDVNTGNISKIADLDAPALYYSTHLAYDHEKNQIFISEQNNKYRSLVKIDVETGKKETLLPFTRTGDLVFNPADQSLWGVRFDNGYCMLVKIPEPYNEMLPMFFAPFGKSVFDLDISSDGKMLSASLSGIQGEQELVLFDIKALELGVRTYQILLKLEDNTLTQFKFSTDNQSLIGTSYYTGVSNIWKVGIKDGSFELLSNTETGYFMPLPYRSDSLFVLRFYRDGMLPGRIPLEVIQEANAIEFLGNQVVQRHPVIEDWSLPPPIALDTASIYEGQYHPLKEMILANAWPDVAGYRNTVAAGYRLFWRDPLSLSQIELFLAGSPWSPYEDKRKIHAHLDWNYWNWKLSASWNKSDFYDLFGPTKRSRAGYTVGLSYENSFTLKDPFRWSYSVAVSTYGDLEVLPQYQNIATPIRNFQAASAGFGISKLRHTLGGVDFEKGYRWSLSGTSYYARQSLFPTLISNLDLGFLIPFGRNNSFWVRNTTGQSFGDKGSALSYFYLGGFRNNYVDWRDARQYRSSIAFPGAEIDEVSAYRFVRTMAELNTKPIRTRNFGFTWLYPTFIYTSFFGSHLAVNPFYESDNRNLFNVGFQTDMEVVLLSYMKTTWSAGYAHVFEKGKPDKGQWMFSLKLLGR